MEIVNWLFIDINSYFASVEQQERPELRGKPLVIIPIEADAGCCIAVSYQAKAYGIHTGCRLQEARKLCPQLEVVMARPRLYVEYHHKIVEAINRCIPVHRVESCDEFTCRLQGFERNSTRATEIGYDIKQAIRALGTTLRCSIGAAPNRFLAKVAGEMQRPDGLMLLTKEHLPHSLHTLALKEIPGVGGRMQRRLHAAGVTTVRELCALSREQMSALWGSVLGDRLWLWMRGEDFEEPASRPRQSLSRQHILPPECRTPEQARDIALKLLHTTGRRMRRIGLRARGMVVHVGFQNGRAWHMGIQIPPSQDLLTLQSHFLMLWSRVPRMTPSDLMVGLCDLEPDTQPDLFQSLEPEASGRVTDAVDQLNLRYGLHTVYPGSIHGARQQAPTRISFGPPPPLEEYNDPADHVGDSSKRAKASGLF